MPDPFFAELYHDTERLSWVPTDQVRRLGRQRTRRTRIAGGLASVVAVAVVATGAAALAGRPDAAPPIVPATESPTPMHTPSGDPTAPAMPTSAPTTTTGRTRTPSTPASSSTSSQPSTNPAIPAAAMLQLADLPDGFRLTEGGPDGDWSLESVTIYCENQSPSIAVGEVARRARVFDSPTDAVDQRVTRHSGDHAATVMDNVRKLVTGCVPSRQGDSLSILAAGLGGDESLLVGAEIEGVPSRWLFVRQGDLVAQVRLDRQTTPAEAQRYAQPVADRLCAGTDAC
ncbi:MAG TPA: hypothetical protein VHN18_15485 [Micromonosporaceae bacterium]|nr:hypothetical protein [Micromonosporaceae bacterium]